MNNEIQLAFVWNLWLLDASCVYPSPLCGCLSKFLTIDLTTSQEPTKGRLAVLCSPTMKQQQWACVCMHVSLCVRMCGRYLCMHASVYVCMYVCICVYYTPWRNVRKSRCLKSSMKDVSVQETKHWSWVGLGWMGMGQWDRSSFSLAGCPGDPHPHNKCNHSLSETGTWACV